MTPRVWAAGRRVVAIGLAVLLVLLAVGPAEAYWRAGFWLGLGTGALLTAPFWWPNAYGSYPYSYPYSYPPYYYPYYQPYPVYVYPAPPTGSLPAPATPTTPTPSPLTPSPPPAPSAGGESPTARNCGTVWIEGHYETLVGSTGQAATVWVPGGSRQFCE